MSMTFRGLVTSVEAINVIAVGTPGDMRQAVEQVRVTVQLRFRGEMTYSCRPDEAPRINTLVDLTITELDS